MPLLAIPTHYEYPNNHIFHTLVVATIFKIFGLNPFLLRAPVLICGVASLILAFFTTHRITRNAQAGLAVSLLIAINGGHIFYSTHARGYMLILLIGQYIFHRLVVWINEPKISLRPTKEFFTIRWTNDGGNLDTSHICIFRRIVGSIFPHLSSVIPT